MERLEPRSKVKKISAAVILGMASVFTSHVGQIMVIENQCITKPSTKSTEAALEDALSKINSLSYKRYDDPGGFKFLFGDFDEDDGKVRCGGIARIACAELAKDGFETHISFEAHGIMAHYYAIVSKDGKTWRIDGSPPYTKATPQ